MARENTTPVPESPDATRARGGCGVVLSLPTSSSAPLPLEGRPDEAIKLLLYRSAETEATAQSRTEEHVNSSRVSRWGAKDRAAAVLLGPILSKVAIPRRECHEFKMWARKKPITTYELSRECPDPVRP